MTEAPNKKVKWILLTIRTISFLTKGNAVNVDGLHAGKCKILFSLVNFHIFIDDKRSHSASLVNLYMPGLLHWYLSTYLVNSKSSFLLFA